MLRVAIGLLVVVVACGGKDPEPATPAGPAGVVVELAGKVSATHAGATRALAVQGDVFADDVVETATDGSVVIVLAHNNAKWSLEGGQKARVDESVAWKLDKQDPAAAVEHATSAAGRHADRQAASTKESVLAESEAPAPASGSGSAASATPAPGSPTVAGTPPTVPPIQAPNADRDKEAAKEDRYEAKKPETKAVPKTENHAAASAEATPKPRGGGGCDEVACVLANYEGACCAKFKKAGATANKPAGDSASSSTSGALAPDVVRRVIAGLRAKIAACHEQHPVDGKVKVKIEIAADGKVSNATAVETPDAALGACVVAVIKTATFPKSGGNMTVNYPFVFQHE